MQEEHVNLRDLTESKLTELISNDSHREVAKNTLERTRSELLRIISDYQTLIDSQNSRATGLITAAGLVSLLFLNIGQPNFLNLFLIWVFPWLALSIIFSVFNMRGRVNFAPDLQVTSDQKEEVLILWRQNRRLDQQSDKIHEICLRQTQFVRISTVATGLFWVSFLLNFYVFIFSTPLSLRENSILTALLFVVGVLILRYFHRQGR